MNEPTSKPPSPPQPLRVTEEEFYRDQDEDSPYQYLGGRMVVCEPVSNLHEDIFGFLLTIMRSVFAERGGGVVRGSRYPMRLDPKWSPEPDIFVVRDDRRSLIGPQRFEGAADLVIEIASPGDVRRALRLKLPRYRKAGIPEIWVIDPYARSIRVEVLTSEIHGSHEIRQPPTYRHREVNIGRLASTVFPWFWIDASWLWQAPLPAPIGCAFRILGRLSS